MVFVCFSLEIYCQSKTSTVNIIERINIFPSVIISIPDGVQFRELLHRRYLRGSRIQEELHQLQLIQVRITHMDPVHIVLILVQEKFGAEKERPHNAD